MILTCNLPSVELLDSPASNKVEPVPVTHDLILCEAVLPISVTELADKMTLAGILLLQSKLSASGRCFMALRVTQSVTTPDPLMDCNQVFPADLHTSFRPNRHNRHNP